MGLLGRAHRFGALGLMVGLVGCGSCEVQGGGPVPGGFDPAAMIPRAGQARLTARGLAPIAQVVLRELQKASSVACAVDADCPSFVDAGGNAIASQCDLLHQRCEELGAATPLAAVQLSLPPETSGLALCRGNQACTLAARIEGLHVTPVANQGAELSVEVRLARSTFSVADFGQGLDCALTVDGAAGLLTATFPLAIGPRTTPGTSPQLVVDVTRAQVQLAPGLLSLAPDPVYGDAGDVALCTASNVGAIQAGLQSRLEGQLLPLAQSLLGQALGKVCDVDADCGAGAVCASEGWCRSDTGTTIVPQALDYSERLILPSLLGSVGYGGRSAAPADSALLIGGTFDSDPLGLDFGVLAGMEPVALDPACAQQLPSPRLRPGYLPPSILPATELADLDYDGTPETPYGIAFGFSKPLLDQLIHSIYSSGLICGTIATGDIDVSTESLAILIPSLRFLTKSHLYARSERPIRLSVHLTQAPEAVIDSGRTVDNGNGPEYQAPVVRLDLKGLQLNLQVLVDERWARVLTIDVDLHLGLGLMVTPANELVPLVGVGVTNLIENVRVSNSELLTESPASLEQAIPTLVSFAFLELAGAQSPIALPQINGVDYQVLGVRGLASGGRYDQLAVYADLNLLQFGNLSAAVETQAQLRQVAVPPTEAFSVTHAGGPVLPTVLVGLSERSPDGRALEHQYALDGGGWSAFFRGAELALARPELLRQGLHHLQLRSRAIGDYRSLDPSPAELDFYVDSEPPQLKVDRTGDQLQIEAFDRVSQDRLRLVLVAGDQTRDLSPDAEGRVDLSADEAAAAPLLVRAIDEAGLVAEVVLVPAPATAAPGPALASGCRATQPGGTSLPWLAFGMLVLVWRRLRAS